MTDREDADAEPSVLMITTVAATLAGFLTPFAAHFRGLGWRVDAASNGASANPRVLGAFDNVYDLPMSRSLLNLPALLRAGGAVARLLDTTRPDLVHVHTPIASFLVRLAIRRMPRERRPAAVYTAHGFHFHPGGPLVSNALFLAAERLAGRWTDRLVVINDEDEAAARRHRIVGSRRLVRMPGIGIDTRWYARSGVDPSDAAVARLELGIGPDVPLIVAVGEFTPNKRQADAIEALGRMDHREASLVLLGDGPTRPALEALVDRLDLRGRVVFAGMVGDVRPIVSTAVALVLNSGREGLARSVMEALALEVPVAATAARGNAELVGDDGFVLPIGDVAALAGALDWLIEHPADARAMGARGRRRMVERYDLQHVIDLHDRLYRAVLAERASRWGSSVGDGTG